MPAGTNQPTPLVHDGVMYLGNPGNVIQALDAASGTLLWEYHRALPESLRTGLIRNLAIYEDRLFLASRDAYLVALDARTGNVVWETQIADYRQGYSNSAGPIVADGKVINAINGCSRFQPDSCFITAHDARTGEELWRTLTIARPGSPLWYRFDRAPRCPPPATSTSSCRPTPEAVRRKQRGCARSSTSAST